MKSESKKRLVPRLLQSIARFAEDIDADDRTARRGLQSKTIPLRVHKIGGMVRIEVAEAEAWVRAGCPTADDGWVWPPEQPDDPAPEAEPELGQRKRLPFLRPHAVAH